MSIIDRSSARLGFWAALGAAFCFAIFTICFVLLAIGRPLFLWTDLTAYIDFIRAYPSPLADIARLSMVVFAVLFVILVNSIYELAAPERKSMARLALCFSIAFAVLSSAHYFIQISAVRISIERDAFAGLEQVIQANPYSAVAAMNMLGWTVFLGLASLFAASVFQGGGSAMVLRVAFIANGVVCLIGGVGYVLGDTLVVFVTMNFLLGAAMFVITFALGHHFWQILAHHPHHVNS